MTENEKLIAKHLPKQVDSDKILKQLKRKVLRETRSPYSMKDLKGAYLNCKFF